MLRIVISANNEKIKLKFKELKSAITPGQSLVIYDKNGYVLAGGIICKLAG